MANHNDLGNWGEEAAITYLEAQGYKILERNWRWGKSEIDIIASDPDGVLTFHEIKTRKNNTFGNPEQAVGLKKQKMMLEAAGEYMYQINYEHEIRFDIIAIITEPNFELMHFKDAFFSSW
jgi:putative endonuclease